MVRLNQAIAAYEDGQRHSTAARNFARDQKPAEAEAEREQAQGRYRDAIDILDPLLRPSAELATENKVIAAGHFYRGLARVELAARVRRQATAVDSERRQADRDNQWFKAIGLRARHDKLMRESTKLYRDAAEDLAAAAANPAYVFVTVNTAAVELRLDEPGRARTTLQKYIGTAREQLAAGIEDEALRRSTEEGFRAAQMFLAVAQYRLGDYQATLDTIDESGLLKSPLAGYAYLYKGLAYIRRREEERAEESLERLRDPGVPAVPDARREAADLQSELAKGARVTEEPLLWNWTLRSSIEYDTNVIILGDNTASPRDIDRKDDVRFSFDNDFSLTLPHAWTGESNDVTFGVTQYNSWHGAIDEFNLQTYAARVGLQHSFDTLKERDLIVGIQYDYDYNLLGNDGFLSRNRVTPYLRFVEWRPKEIDRAYVTLHYSYEDRDYEELLSLRVLDRDGSYNTIGVEQVLLLWRPEWVSPKAPEYEGWLRLIWAFRAATNATQGDEYDGKSWAFSHRIEVPLPFDSTFDFTGTWAWEDYNNRSVFDFRRRAREDFIQRYAFGLEHVLLRREPGLSHLHDPDIRVRGEIAWQQDDANTIDRLNQAVFSYDRVIYALSLILSF